MADGTPTLTAHSVSVTTESSALHQSIFQWKMEVRDRGWRKPSGEEWVACLIFLLLQIWLRRLDSGAHHLGLLQVCSHPRQVLRKQSFLPTRSGCLRLAPMEKMIAGDRRAEHHIQLPRLGCWLAGCPPVLTGTLLYPLQHELGGHGEEQSPQHQGDGAPGQCKGTN